jgi:hypothetical protein
MDSKYFEKFIKDLINENEEFSEDGLLSESDNKQTKNNKKIVIEENYARKLIRRYSEDHLNSVRYKK